MRIGLLADSPVVAELLTIALRLAGHSVTAYASLSPLLDELSDHAGLKRFHLLLVDCEPGHDLAALAQLQAVASSDALPAIVVLTASSRAEIDQAQRAYPHLPFLQRPFHFKTLFALMAECVLPTD